MIFQGSSILIISCIFITLFPIRTNSIECYTGLKILKGQAVGSATIKCDNSGAYCYNMTASAASLLEVTKAGCSMWRCMFAQNKCISTVFQKIPISLCCCNTPFCNVGDNQNSVIQPQTSGGWNAEPEHTRTELTKDEVERRFNSAELDDDMEGHSTRASRLELHSENVTAESLTTSSNATTPIDEDESIEIKLLI